MPRPWASALIAALNTVLLALVLAPLFVYAQKLCYESESHYNRSDNSYTIKPFQKGTKVRDGDCKTKFREYYSTIIPGFLWNGHVDGFRRDKTPLDAVCATNGTLLFVKRDICEYACGTSPEWYGWATSAQTLTTWILPICSLVLQLPYESEKSWASLVSTFRWLGNPIASLTTELWNLRVASRCAKLADMAESGDMKLEANKKIFKARYSNPAEYEKYRQVEAVRDSLFILSTANQFTIKTKTNKDKFRLVLLDVLFDPRFATDRRRLARAIRFDRKKGVVIQFASILWFGVALVISIQAAFGELGKNAAAHNLALGLLMIWLPMLVVASVVDRNPVHADEVLRDINIFIEKSYDFLEKNPAPDGSRARNFPRRTILSEQTVSDADFTPRPLYRQESYALDALANGLFYTEPLLNRDSPDRRRPSRSGAQATVPPRQYPSEDFEYAFETFAGQGRQKWHYGIAHSALRVLEGRIVKEQRKVRGELDGGHTFNRSQNSVRRNWAKLYQDGKLLKFEEDDSDEQVEVRAKRPLNVTGEILRFDWAESWQVVCTVLLVFMPALGAFLISYYTPTVGLGCRAGGYVILAVLTAACYLLEVIGWMVLGSYNQRIRERYRRLEDMEERGDEASVRVKEEISLLQERPWFAVYGHGISLLEAANTGWLLYITVQQTFGGYNTCKCRSTSWGSAGGYITYSEPELTAKYFRTRYWWTWASVLGCLPFAVGLLYAVLQWCLQSHLWTMDRWHARRGVYKVRLWRACTMWLYNLVRKVVIDIPLEVLWNVDVGRNSRLQHTDLIWLGMKVENNYDWKVAEAREDPSRVIGRV